VIRINLLEETRTASKRKGGGGGLSMPSLDVAENVGVVIMFAGILLAAGIMGTWFMINAGTISDLEEKIAKAEAEKKRLEYVLKRNEELKAAKKELTHRIEIIRQLKENQGKPVKMMLEVSRELDEADNVWFEDLTFSGDKLSVKGKALSKFNYSKFLKNLEDSSCFDDVRMGITEEQPGPDGQTLVSFRMQALFVVDCGASKAAAEAAKKKNKGGQAPPRR
jgi:Tfp pilus assembly protein PilN